MSTIEVDIEGLNLILGGGISILTRHPDFADESATIVVRGPPGSGKTILGTQLAGALGRTLRCDVAYGCIEILPSELAAQHGGIKRPGVSERVVQAPFTMHEPRGSTCRIFAGMLDVETSTGGGGARITDTISDMLAAIEEVGGKPRILVIDSLSDGYQLGASAPRPLADDLCKMAAQKGMIFILLEESIGLAPSVWCFACDMVFELGASEDEHAAGMPSLFMRRMVVSKNRLGASDPGPHRFNLIPGEGVRILPRPTSYLLPWAKAVALDRLMPAHRGNMPAPRWGFAELDGTGGWPPFGKCVTAIHGAEAREVFAVARHVGGGTNNMMDVLLIDFNAQAFGDLRGLREGPSWSTVSLGNPFVNSAQIVADTLAKIKDLHRSSRRVGWVLIGDLQALRSFWDAEGCRRAVGILIAVLRQLAIPGVLFETTAPRSTWEVAASRIRFASRIKPDTHKGAYPSDPAFGRFIERSTEVTTPSSVDFADVVLEIESGANRNPKEGLPITATDVRRGQQLEVFLPRP